MDDTAFPETADYDCEHHDRATATARRVGTRFAAMLLALLTLDLVVATVFSAGDHAPDWRMPRTLPTSRLAPFVDHIERSGASEASPLVVFAGSSPTWGDAVDNPGETVPASYRRTAEADGRELRVRNLASNGQLLGDIYFVANRLADDADLLMVQLTYHGLNREWRQGATRRYPEIPALLGVPIDAEMAGVLEAETTRMPDLTGSFDRSLRRHWALYGMRDVIAGELLGSTPERRLFERWETLAMPGFAGEAERIPSGEPFEMLEPDEQLLILDEFASAGDFVLDPTDSQVLVLERLAADLAASGTRTVFYVSPINIEALDSYDLFDGDQYATNISQLREIVESEGHLFLDLNDDSPVPSSGFADINHTTADGSEMVAAELWRYTRDHVESTR